MKIDCNRQDIVDALTNVSRAAAVKSALTVIEGVFMKAGRYGLYLCCYNLDMGISKTVDASVEREGSVVVPKKFIDLVRKMPGDRVTVDCDEKLIVTISSGLAKYQINGMPSIDFPELPVVDGEHSISLSEAKLRSMISQTSHAISTRQEKPVYTGALFDVEKDTLHVVTLDGFRVAVRNESIMSLEEYQFIVPGKTLNEIKNLLSDSDDIAELSVAKHNIIFMINGYNIISRLMSGSFLNYRSAFKAENAMVARVKTSELSACADRISLLISESQKSPVHCFFDINSIRLVCSTQIGKADDEIDCDCDCEKLEIGLNGKYLLDAVKAADTDVLRILFKDARTPIQILPPDGDSFMFLLMPVML